MEKTLGTEGIKRLLTQVFQNLKLDRNNDGQVSGAEWFAAAMSLLPEVISSGFIAEARDLTKDELSDIFYWVHDHFPENAPFMPEIEKVVAKFARVGGAVSELWKAVEDLRTARNTPPEVPAETSAVGEKNKPAPVNAATAKSRAGAQKVDPAPDSTGEGSENEHNPDSTGEKSTEGTVIDAAGEITQDEPVLTDEV